MFAENWHGSRAAEFKPVFTERWWRTVSRNCVFIIPIFLSSCTAQCRKIGYRHDTVVCLSVCYDVYCGTRISVGVESCTVVHLGWTLPIHFWETFSLGCIVQPQNSVKTEPPRFQYLEWSWAYGDHGHSRCYIFDSLVLQLYHWSYTVQLAFWTYLWCDFCW